MGGSRNLNLTHQISNIMKTTNNQEQRVRRFMTSREEAINRCLNSLIHTLQCREGESCRTHGCLKMKRVIEHTKICPKKNNSPRCTICTQLMSLCFYHSKICRANACLVPFCRVMKKKLQSLNEHYAQKQSVQSLKPVYQFPIPPLHLVLPMQPSAAPTAVDRRERDSNSEPIPKRVRLDESESESDSIANNNDNAVAQHSNVTINNNFNSMLIFENNNAQVSRTVDEIEVA